MIETPSKLTRALGEEWSGLRRCSFRRTFSSSLLFQVWKDGWSFPVGRLRCMTCGTRRACTFGNLEAYSPGWRNSPTQTQYGAVAQHVLDQLIGLHALGQAQDGATERAGE